MKDGGPAFPTMTAREQLSNNDNFVTVHEPQGGMSLRDYFAARSIPALMMAVFQALETREATDDTVAELEAKVAEKAYRIADAMLAERERGR